MVKNNLTLSGACCLEKNGSMKNKSPSAVFKRMILFAEVLGRAILEFFKLPVKKRETFISNLVTNITYRFVRFKQQVACHIDPVLIQKEKEWFIHYFAEEPGKGFLRHINHSR